MSRSKRNFFYDSDEDVSWGRITAKEVKERFYIPSFEEKNKDTSIPSVADYLSTNTNSVSSKYCSVTDSIAADKSSLYFSTNEGEKPVCNSIDNQKKVINSTNSAYDNDYHYDSDLNNVCKKSDINKTVDLTGSSSGYENDNHISDHTHLCNKSDTWKIVELTGSSSSYENDNHISDHTHLCNKSDTCKIVDLTGSPSSYENDNHISDHTDLCNKSDTCKIVDLTGSPSSYENDNHISDHTDLCNKSDTCKIIELTGSSSSYENDNQISDYINVFNKSDMSKVVDLTCSSSGYENDNNYISDHINVSNESDKNKVEDLDCSSTNFEKEDNESGINNLDISSSFSELDKDSYSALNNTFDRINAILEKELTLKDHKEPEKIFDTSCNIISGSFLKNQKELNSFDKKTSIKTPIIKIKTPSRSNVTPKTHIPIVKKTPEFKMPDAPIKPKSASKPKLNLKNIVSPVKMYIKYSPKAPLVQSVHSVEKPAAKFTSTTKYSQNKSTGMSFPKVMYKPSEKQIVASKKYTELPKSINKMINRREVIRHEKNNDQIHLNETLDPEAELSKSYLSTSDVNVSVWHKKDVLDN